MEVKRESIYVGLLSKSNFFAFEYLRKIIFTLNESKGYDLYNHDKEISYLTYKPKRYHSYYIDYSISLDSVLEKMGYPAILNETLIKKLLSEDLETLFISNGLLQILHKYAMEDYHPGLYQQNFNAVQQEFTVREEEVNNGKIKRR